MSKLENELSVEAVARALYDVAIDSLVPGKDAAILNAGINAAARLAKMQGWDALDKHEISKPSEFESMTSEERRAKIVELTERIKKPAGGEQA